MLRDTLEHRINQAQSEINKINDKVDAMLTTVDYEEESLSSGKKGAITKWRNSVAKFEETIRDTQAKIDALQTNDTETKEETESTTSASNENTQTANENTGPTTPVQSVDSSASNHSGGGDSVTKALKSMIKDFQNQPTFGSGMDIAVFLKHMNMVYNCHVKLNGSLESDFVTLVEQHLDTSARVELQKHVETKGRFIKWATMEDYLLVTYKSCSTIFQEISRFSSLPMRRNETVREYCTRVKQVGDEAYCVIASKFKDQTSKTMGASDLFQLVMCDAVIRAMQADSTLRQHYNLIVDDIDGCLTLDALGHRASKISDRLCTIDLTDESRTFLSQSGVTQNPAVDLSKQMAALQEQMALLAKHNEPKPSNENKSDSGLQKSKPRTRKDIWNDPEWRKKQAKNDCRNYQDYGKCVRENCPFNPCYKKSAGGALYATVGDFQ